MSENNSNGKMTTIITNVICGSSTQKCQTTIFVPVKNDIEPTQVLGCFITNEKIHKNTIEDFSNNKTNVKIDGELEIHVWYETEGASDVTKKNIKFSEVIPLEKYVEAKEFNHKSISAWINKTPNSLGTMIVNKSGIPMISIQIEYELGVKVIGETGINVLAYKMKNSDLETNLHFIHKEDLDFPDINYDDVD